MAEPHKLSTLRRSFGWLLLLTGVAVFAVRLQHAGSYAFPGGGNLRAALLALLLGGWLARDWASGPFATRLRWAALATGPVVLFFALYAVLAELEEVVTLKARDAAGRPADLRLWIIDHEGVAWVTMGRAKAVEHSLDGARLELLRDGELRCVVAHVEGDREAVNAIHHRRALKYRVQGLATALGVMGRDAAEDSVAVRLEACPEG